MKRLRQPILAAILWLAGLQAAPQQPATTGRGRGAQPTGQSVPQQQNICTVNGVVVPCAPASRPAQQAPTTPGQVEAGRQPAPSEILSGTVRRVDTEEKLPEVRLELKNGLVELPAGFDKPCKPTSVIETDGSRQFATSDTAGHFVFPYSAPAGVTVSTLILERDAILGGRKLIPEREGYVQAPWTKSDSELLKPITDVDMIPAPTISGRVSDPSGRPLAAAVVQAWRVRYTPLGRTLKWTRSTLSNDMGDFRLSWLPFGNYYIAAGLSSYVQQPWLESLRITPNLPEPDQGLPMLFYPGVVNARDAGLVRVRIPQGPAATVLAPVVTQALRERPRFNIRLRLVADPIPANAQIVFLPYGGDLCAGLDYAIKGNADGTFDIRDVPAGLYVLVAIRGREVISELIPVNVEKNIDDLKLPLTVPTELRGTITFDSLPVGFTPAALGINLDPSNLRINLTRAGSEVSHVATSLMNPATGNFSISFPAIKVNICMQK